MFDIGLEKGKYSSRYAIPSELRNNLYVRYKNQIYTINYHYRELHKNRIVPQLSLDAKPESGILAFRGVVSKGQTKFLEALKNGGLTSEADWIFDFSDHYVKFKGEYYKLNFTHLDIPDYSISPTVYEEQ